LYKEINFAVVERMGKLQMRQVPRTIAPECREQLFPLQDKSSGEIAFVALSLWAA
jgi:hypothetical protein